MNAIISPTVWSNLDVINLNLAAKSAPDAVLELHAAVAQLDAVVDAQGLLRDLLARQKLGANCLSTEIALPHARTMAVNRFVVVVGRSESGINFDEQRPAIKLVFLVCVPASAVTEYLRWIARFARTLRNPALCNALLGAPTAVDFRSIWNRACNGPGRFFKTGE